MMICGPFLFAAVHSRGSKKVREVGWRVHLGESISWNSSHDLYPLVALVRRYRQVEIVHIAIGDLEGISGSIVGRFFRREFLLISFERDR